MRKPFLWLHSKICILLVMLFGNLGIFELQWSFIWVNPLPVSIPEMVLFLKSYFFEYYFLIVPHKVNSVRRGEPTSITDILRCLRNSSRDLSLKTPEVWGLEWIIGIRVRRTLVCPWFQIRVHFKSSLWWNSFLSWFSHPLVEVDFPCKINCFLPILFRKV